MPNMDGTGPRTQGTGFGRGGCQNQNRRGCGRGMRCGQGRRNGACRWNTARENLLEERDGLKARLAAVEQQLAE